MPAPLPPTFAGTRAALHAIAEHVLAPARYRFDGHIGLTPTPGGFGTPPYGPGEVARVDGVEIVREQAGEVTRAAITTLAAAAACVGVPLGAPAGVYPPATACTPDEPLMVDVPAAAALADWMALTGPVLEELRETYAAYSPSAVQLWPEHFDLGCDFGDAAAGTRANYGASPGDDALAEPYLYAGPWDASRATGVFAACPFGAALTYAELLETGDPAAATRRFFEECASLLLTQ